MSTVPSLVRLPMNVHFKRSNVRKGRLPEDFVRTLMLEAYGIRNVVGNGIEDGRTESGADFTVVSGDKQYGIEVKYWDKVGDHVVRRGFLKRQVLDRFAPIQNRIIARILIVFGRLPKNSYQFRRWCREESITLIHLSIPQDELNVVSKAFALCDDEVYERILPLLANHYASKFKAEITKQVSRVVGHVKSCLSTVEERVFPISERRCVDRVSSLYMGRPLPARRIRCRLKLAGFAGGCAGLDAPCREPERIWRRVKPCFAVIREFSAYINNMPVQPTRGVAATDELHIRQGLGYRIAALRNFGLALVSLRPHLGDNP